MNLRRVASGLDHGIRTSLRNNVSAYGFSVMITASFGAISAIEGPPTVGRVFLFVAGAVTSVTLIDGISSKGFRVRWRGDPSDVIALGAALGYLSVGGGVGGAALAAEILGGWVGWVVAPAVASGVYVLLSGVEMALARALQQEREDAEEEEGEGGREEEEDVNEGGREEEEGENEGENPPD